MITPEEFPYIKSLYVNDCYAYKDFTIELHDYKPFSHLILTGKNGSGKSTILRSLDTHINIYRRGDEPSDIVINLRKTLASYKTSYGEENPITKGVVNTLFDHVVLSSIYKIERSKLWAEGKPQLVYSYLKARRNSRVDAVSTVSKESDFISQLHSNDSPDKFISQFKQYLVNKKIYQAFDQINNNELRFAETNDFFNRLTSSFKEIFEDGNLILEFRQEDFEFFITLSDGRKLTFDVLSEGFSALLSILMDLFMRVDLIRKQVGDYTYNPCGVVLIDEPETHLHLQLQEQVLPLLTRLFPNVQFIAATHSPAVIASIKQATIFDLTTKESRPSEDTVGRSYSDLMRSHFGLNNEYSSIADTLFQQVDEILRENKRRPEELKNKLEQFFVENEAYFSPSFRVEIEAMLLENA